MGGDIGGATHPLRPGSYAYLPPGADWSVRNQGSEPARFHWVRKAYQAAPGLNAPDAFVTHDAEIEPSGMAGSNGAWATTRFVDPNDLRFARHSRGSNYSRLFL